MVASNASANSTARTIFAFGGQINPVFIKYIAGLTNKKRPALLFIPTASADHAGYIDFWYQSCAGLQVRATVMLTFISSDPKQQTFEEQIMQADAIVVGGGSTLNMLAIWKAQGIDTALRKAYDKGIVLAGGSAGSTCWFTGGFTDSRPKALTLIECLSFLPFSHCPHYNSEAKRKPLYADAILTGKLLPGYACDDLAGLLINNETVTKSVSQNTVNNSYFISVVNGKIKETLLPAEMIE